MSLSRLKLSALRKLIVPILCSYLLFQVCSCFKGTENEGRIETSLGRKSKNLFPFVWVTFQASPCGTDNNGVCVQRGKCTKRGGVTNGNCQDAFGECCVFTEKCDVNHTRIDVNQLVTVLDSPTPSNTECTFRFRKEPNICQIRLDFETYTSAGADSDGNCVTDRLRITNSITVKDFTTCGDLTGQHMYLTFGSQDSIEVTPILQMLMSRYKIIATRIPCDSKNRAPDYCLQYFTKSMGRVMSFDFGRQQQDNQEYTICVKPMPTSNEIQWKPCTGIMGSPFDIVSNIEAIPHPCDTDWIQAKGSARFCESFSNITSHWKPYELLVHFDGMELPAPPPGFNLPVNLDNCAAECVSAQPAVYDCACLPQPPAPPLDPVFTACQCVLTLNSMSGGPDFNNTGFCLDYTQL